MIDGLRLILVRVWQMFGIGLIRNIVRAIATVALIGDLPMVVEAVGGAVEAEEGEDRVEVRVEEVEVKAAVEICQEKIIMLQTIGVQETSNALMAAIIKMLGKTERSLMTLVER